MVKHFCFLWLITRLSQAGELESKEAHLVSEFYSNIRTTGFLFGRIKTQGDTGFHLIRERANPYVCVSVCTRTRVSSYKGNSIEVGAMAQWVKCFLWKQEKLKRRSQEVGEGDGGWRAQMSWKPGREHSRKGGDPESSTAEQGSVK